MAGCGSRTRSGAALYRMSAAGQGPQVLAHDEGGTNDWNAYPDGIARAANGTLWFADPLESTDPTVNIRRGRHRVLRTARADGACPASSANGGGGSGLARAFGGVNLHGGTLKVRHGVATVTLSSALAATGTLKLTNVINPKTGRVISAKSTRKTLLLGKKAFSVNTGQTKKVKIRLSNGARKLLKTHKKLKATLSAISTDTYGTHKTTKKKVTNSSSSSEHVTCLA